MEQDIVRFLTSMVFPPGGFVLLFALALLTWNSRPRFSRFLVGMGTFALFMLSLPITSGYLMRTVEPYPPLKKSHISEHQSQAIIVLAGGRHQYAPEYPGRETVNTMSLVRLRYGAKLHRDTGLPILLTGGNGTESRPPEAQIMSRVLKNDFNIDSRWMETESRTTAENAAYSWDILSNENINRIILVSNAWHLHRAVPVFEQNGFNVLAGPTMFERINKPKSLRFSDFVPDAKAFLDSYYALHELVGRIWYEIRY